MQDLNHLMSPLMVVQTLADSQYATLSDIKVGTGHWATCLHRSCDLLFQALPGDEVHTL